MINCVNCNKEIILNSSTGDNYIQKEKRVYCWTCYDILKCLNCGGIREHSDKCSSCFELVRHQNLKQGLCKYCRMKTEDPDSYAEAKHMGLTIDTPSYLSFSDPAGFDGNSFDEHPEDFQ